MNFVSRGWQLTNLWPLNSRLRFFSLIHGHDKLNIMCFLHENVIYILNNNTKLELVIKIHHCIVIKHQRLFVPFHLLRQQPAICYSQIILKKIKWTQKNSKAWLIYFNSNTPLYWVVLSCGTVYYPVHDDSNFWVNGWNPAMWPFQMKTIEQYCVVLFIMLYWHDGSNFWVNRWNPAVWPIKFSLLITHHFTPLLTSLMVIRSRNQLGCSPTLSCHTWILQRLLLKLFGTLK